MVELVGVLVCIVSLMLAIYAYYDVDLEEEKGRAGKIQKRFIVMRISFALYSIGFLLTMGSLSFKNVPFPFHAFVIMLALGLVVTYGQYSARVRLLEWRSEGRS